MLVLSLRTGERVKVGDDIWVTLTEVRNGSAIRLGFDAPKSVKIFREELLIREREIPTVFGKLPVGEFK